MASTTVVILACCLAVISALPAQDPVIAKLNPSGLRYSYQEDDNGNAHLVDEWMKLSDLDRVARYSPDSSNVYHLFTRANPSSSQPLVLNNANLVTGSNFDARKRTIVLMHGFLGSATSDFNAVLVPAFLQAADCNVLVLDWSAGAWWGPNANQAGQAAGRFINWLNNLTGSSPFMYHVVGYSVGGHGAGITARNVDGDIGYVTALDPAERWSSDQMFRPDDGIYTEVIHTSSLGEIAPLGQVDFYPNGGNSMPGCLTDLCNHLRSYYYLGESLRRGGFTGTQCLDLEQATSGNCSGSGRLAMGGIAAKFGSTGLYYMRTNSFPPFSRG